MKRKISVAILLTFIFFGIYNNPALAAVATGSPVNYAADIKDVFSNDTNKAVTDIVITENFRGDEDNTHLYALLNKTNLYVKPLSVTTDEKGNKTATFKIPRLNPGESVEIGEKLYLEGKSVNYTIKASQVGNDYSGVPFASLYLKPSPRIESDDPQIVQAAREIVGQETNPYLKARKIYGFVNSYITYDESQQYSNKGALSALATARGVCYEYSSLMVALLRSSGVPARMVAGYKVEKDEINSMPRFPDGSIDISNSAHAWVEFYLPGIGWVPSEPTVKFTVNGKKHISWDFFTNLDSPLYIPVSIDNKMESKWSSVGHLTLKRVEALQINPADFAAPGTDPKVIAQEDPEAKTINFVKDTFNPDQFKNWAQNQFLPFVENLLSGVPTLFLFLIPVSLISLWVLFRAL